MTREEEAQRARRAAELLDGASWLFDEVVAACQREWLTCLDAISGPVRREELHQRATATLGLKAHLLTIVNQQQGQEAINERRERRTGDGT